jgi:hypothetical protein
MTFCAVNGYEGLYEISATGIIRSLDRNVVGKDGVLYPFKGREIKPSPNTKVQYLQLSLWKAGVGKSHYVHRLVAEAFIDNPLQLPEVNHIDGNRQHNCVVNLEWVSRQGNAQHAVDHNLKTYTNRLTYSEFVECVLSVIAGESYQSLSQRVPYKVPFLSVKLRAIAKELKLEQDLNASLQEQRINRARSNGAKNHPTH